MTLGYDQPLYFLPSDHRGSFKTGLFGWKGELTPAQTKRVSEAKQVIYDAFEFAIAEGDRRAKGGDSGRRTVRSRDPALEKKVNEWLMTAASVAGFTGFAVGRTAFRRSQGAIGSL